MQPEEQWELHQELYTGIDLGEGPVGLITYMRTDSINLKEATDEIRQIIPKLFGDDALPDKIREYTNTSKNAQEAHEAIRPTAFSRTHQMKQKNI